MQINFEQFLQLVNLVIVPMFAFMFRDMREVRERLVAIETHLGIKADQRRIKE